jgi:hypothetical protein
MSGTTPVPISIWAEVVEDERKAMLLAEDADPLFPRVRGLMRSVQGPAQPAGGTLTRWRRHIGGGCSRLSVCAR